MQRQMINLYLDDLRACPAGFMLARNAEECIALLQEYDVQMLSLDYELGWNEPNGLAVAQFIAMNLTEATFPREIYMHSSSPSGRASMYQLLYSHKPDGVRVYNSPVPDEILLRLQNDNL